MSETQERAGSVERSWQRIDSWLAGNASSVAKSLREGATADDVARFEKRLGVTLPADFKESCAIHDGQKRQAGLIPIIKWRWKLLVPGTYFLLPLSKIPHGQKLWNVVMKMCDFDGIHDKVDKGITADRWNPGWIPFASNGGGDHLCLDLAPASEGTVGQVITVEHDCAERELLAPSFADWLDGLAAALERGELLPFLE